MHKRKKFHLLLLVTFLLSVMLLITSLILMIRLGSVQKQIDNLEKTIQVLEVAKQQEAQEQAELEAAAKQDPTPAPAATLKPDDGTKYAYLTFDDGPSRNTERILAVLKQYGVKATFFVNGREDEESQTRYQKMVDEGHALAMHSYTHDYAEMYGSKDAFVEDYYKIYSLIENYTGYGPKVYRFPGGGSNRLTSRNVAMSELAEFLQEQGVEYFDWNVDSTDGAGPNRPVQTLYENVAKNLKHTHNVILLHDANDHDTTVDALPSIIQACKDAGLTFAILDESVPPVQHNLAD